MCSANSQRYGYLLPHLLPTVFGPSSGFQTVRSLASIHAFGVALCVLLILFVMVAQPPTDRDHNITPVEEHPFVLASQAAPQEPRDVKDVEGGDEENVMVLGV